MRKLTTLKHVFRIIVSKHTEPSTKWNCRVSAKRLPLPLAQPSCIGLPCIAPTVAQCPSSSHLLWHHTLSFAIVFRAQVPLSAPPGNASLKNLAHKTECTFPIDSPFHLQIASLELVQNTQTLICLPLSSLTFNFSCLNSNNQQ